MKYKVTYNYFNQALNKSAEWENRSKVFNNKLDAQRFAQRLIDNVSVRNLNIEATI
jgi:hypothetical protein